MEKIAIIGCGYSGTVVLHRLKKLDPDRPVDIFDPAGANGHGLAYQPDISSNLINRPANLMWLDEPGDFARWLRENSFNKKDYQPRASFGQFLKSQLEKLIINSVNIQVFAQPVLAIADAQPEGYWIATPEGKHGTYTAIILATGNPEPYDAYHLSGKLNYYNSAYPTSRLLQIRSNQIGVIGNQLSAIDTSIALLEQHPDNRVTLLSRRSKLPNHSGNYHPRPLNVINDKHLEESLGSKSLSLATIRQLFDAELFSQGVNVTLMDLMADHSKADIAREKIYSILSATNLWVPRLWNLISEREKNIFSRRYARHWRQLRVPTPTESHDKIHDFIKRGRLKIRPRITDIHSYTPGKFKARGCNYEEIFTHVINATGAGNPINTPLYRSMVKRGLCQPNDYGGIKVRPDDCRVIGTHNTHNIFAIGTPTIGDFFSISNIDILQMQANIISKEL